MWKKSISFIFFTILIATLSCSSMMKKYVITIGIDPSFISSPVGNKEGDVHAFCVELVEKVYEKTNYSINYITLSSDNMFESLHDNTVDLIVSSLDENYESTNKYYFSSAFLPLGDVFVSRRMSESSIADFSGKIIAVQNSAEIIALFADYSGVNLTFYTKIPVVLEDIANYTVDGAIIPVLHLASHMSNEYMHLLKVYPKILTKTSLKLIAKKNTQKRAIHAFNQQLVLFKEEGILQRLYRKWDLY